MKKLASFAALLFAVVVLNGCSQDAEFETSQETASPGLLTSEQRAQVMELADYYGLDVEIDETPRTRGATGAFNLDSINAIFLGVSAMKGEYICVQTDSASAVFICPEMTSLQVSRAIWPLPEQYSGTFADKSTANGYTYTINVSWSYSGDAGRVSVSVDCTSMHGAYFVTRNLQYQFTGAVPSFTFQGEVYVYNIEPYGLAFRLSVSGFYSATSQSGRAYIS